MRIKQSPADFRVEEHVHLPGSEGAYAYYRVEKEGVSTVTVRDAMAARLKVTPSALVFPALKDATAISIQYASVRKRGPVEISGQGYVARRVQWGPRALRPMDLENNQFTIVVRDLLQSEAGGLGTALGKLAEFGLVNYFDDQRFGSLTKDGFIGKEILKRDAERVVHMYLAEPMAGDPQEVREFKELVTSHWGQWGYLLHQAPRPSNFRSVITYLKDHPHDYPKATNLIQDRLLSIYLSAYQSWVWNQIVGRYLSRRFDTKFVMEIMEQQFPLPEPVAERVELESVLVDLPRLTSTYEGDLTEPAEEVFAHEGLEIRDFKARILRRVYLSRGERPVWFRPAAVTCESPAPDDGDGRYKVSISFTLDSGRYATLVLKAAAALMGTSLRAR